MPPVTRIRATLLGVVTIILILAGRSWLKSPAKEIRPLIEARERGDERGVERIIKGLLENAGLSGALLDKLAALALHDYWTWNTEFPSWKKSLAERWLDAWGLRDTEDFRTFLPAVPVTVICPIIAGGEGPLFLAGNWNSAGELSDMGAWKTVPMVRKGGVWQAQLRLHPTRLRHLYHAVARTQPWPAGRGVAWGEFEVRGPGAVAVLNREAAKGESTALAGIMKKNVGLSVLGMDGASWSLILPWVHRGILPNFARLWREGAVATLTAEGNQSGGYSTVANVYSAMTGNLSCRHGLGGGPGHGNFNTNAARKSSPVWKIAAGHGRTTAVVGLPGSFPPDELPGGALVSDAFIALRVRERLDAEKLIEDKAVMAFAEEFLVTKAFMLRLFWFMDIVNKRFETTYPHALGEELKPVLSRGHLAGDGGLGDVAVAYDEHVRESTAGVLDKNDYDLFFAFLIEIDAASHHDWNDRQGRVLEAYRKADRFLGELMARSEHVLVWSDHGFGPSHKEYGPDSARINSLHTGNGIFAAWGPSIKTSRITEPLFITDVAPAVLYLSGVPVGSNIDGRYQEGLFKEAHLKRDPVQRVPRHGTGGGFWGRFIRALRWD